MTPAQNHHGITTDKAIAPVMSLEAGRFTFPITGYTKADIHESAIAHALARKVRFNGHLNSGFTVAEHCLMVRQLLARRGHSWRIQLMGLWHDAGEGMLPDMPTPWKDVIPGYREAERELDKVVVDALGLPPVTEPLWRAVKVADHDALVIEARLFFDTIPSWVPEIPDERVEMWEVYEDFKEETHLLDLEDVNARHVAVMAQMLELSAELRKRIATPNPFAYLRDFGKDHDSGGFVQ